MTIAPPLTLNVEGRFFISINQKSKGDKMNELNIIKQSGGAYIDSREVAEAIGKNHKDLLRDIRKYITVLEKIGQRNFAPSDFFIESSFFNAQNKEMPRYLLSKMGCELMANKLIGEKGIMFTAAYVAKFNEMEKSERDAEIKSHARPRLSEFNYAVRNVLNGMSLSHQQPVRVMKFLTGVYDKLGVEVLPFCEDDCFGYYSVTEIAYEIGIYSDNNRPHSHAISAIIQKIDDHAKHAIVVPYGLVGVMVRYDWYMVIAVMRWLVDNDCPCEIPYLGFTYHIHYNVDKKHSNDEVIDLDDDFFTADELDEMCGKYGECDECPGFPSCCNTD